MLKSKKGFTLTELCVAMAAAAIIGTMIVSSVIFVTQQNNDIKKESSFITEVTDIQRIMGDWLKKYDNAGYNITHNGGQTQLQAQKGAAVSTLTFADDAVQVDGSKISEDYKNISEIGFQIVEDKAADGAVEGKVAQIIVTAKKDTGTETQTLLFPLFSNITRQRKVEGR